MTLLEMIAAIVFLTIIGQAVWSTARSVGQQRMREWRSADVSGASESAEAALRRTLESAGRGMLSMPNVSGIYGSIAGNDGQERDTLIALLPLAAAIRNAAEPCPIEGECIVLIGDRRGELALGDVLVVGAPAVGGRLAQIAGEPFLFTAPCGADCVANIECAEISDPEDAPLGGHLQVTAADDGSGPVAGATCDQPFTLAGQCRELIELVTFRRQLSFCSVKPRVQTFTAVPITDRTGAAGLPMMPRSPLASAGATPMIRTQQVRPTRFWLRTLAGGESALVRQVGWNSDGHWNPPRTVAASVTSLKIEFMHRGDLEWTRGVGITSQMLHVSSGNVRRRTTPAAGKQALEFLRSFGTIGSVRVGFTVPHIQEDGQVTPTEHWLVVDTSDNLDGGSDGGPGG